MHSTNSPEQGDAQKDPAIALADRLRNSRDTLESVKARLSVDDRVLARVTDGIYRRPSAALRELVFNAYDADATQVVIDTDAPRFQRMSIRDNGIGMDERALADLITHIGGSSKRTNKGIEIGTVNRENPHLSPAGRQLIGKIGIGLFAVVHLTTNFRIITKRKGSAYRLVADVQMKTHTEENLANLIPGAGGKEFVTGDVFLVQEPASDIETQGTEVVLLELRRTIRDILRDAERWDAILEERTEQDERSRAAPGRDPHYRLAEPQFHVGFLSVPDSSDSADYLIVPSLPWGEGDRPAQRFSSLYDSVVKSTGTTARNPDLEYIFDQYFETLWRLSLAAPINYLEEHPLRLTADSGIDFFRLQNKARSRVEPLRLEKGEALDDRLELSSVDRDPCGGFSVLIDGVELRRPVKLYGELMETKSARSVRASRPMLFVGKCETSLGNYDPEQSGGALEFEAYFYWNALIVPNQNRGVLVRVHGASGVLYDERFMDYQTAELNRLKQITGEVFILKGMDPALNIDRESFNVSHPHYQYVAKWVHNSVRQITNLLKEIGKKSIDQEQVTRKLKARSALETSLEAIWERSGDELQQPPEISIFPKENSQAELQFRSEGGMAFHLPPAELQRATASSGRSTLPPAAEQAKAIMTALLAYGLLDSVPYSRQQQIFEDIVGILLSGRDS